MQFDTVVNYMGYNDIQETTMEFNRAGWKEENLQDQAGVISYSMFIKQRYDKDDVKDKFEQVTARNVLITEWYEKIKILILVLFFCLEIWMNYCHVIEPKSHYSARNIG